MPPPLSLAEQQQLVASLPTMTVVDDVYLKQTQLQQALANRLYPDGVDSAETFQALVTLTTTVAANALFAGSYDLTPPTVPFGQHGTYFIKVPPLPSDLLDKLEAMTRPHPHYPFAYIRQRRAQRILRQKSDWEDVVSDLALDVGMQQRGYVKETLNGTTIFEKPLLLQHPIDELVMQLVSYLNAQQGGVLHISTLIREASYAAYNHGYSCQTLDADTFPQLVNIIQQVLEQTDYEIVPDDEHLVQPRPIAVDEDEIEAAKAMALEQVSPTDSVIPRNSLFEAIKDRWPATTRSFVFTRFFDEAVAPALTEIGYRTVAAQQFGRYIFLPTINLQSSDNDGMRQIVFSKGEKVAIPVFAPLLIVDSVSAEVVAIRMVGPAEAVKANWAMLVSGHSKQQVMLNGAFITTKGAKHFHTLKTVLPSGLVDWCLIHHQAAAQTVKPDRPFYVFTESITERPDQFFAILDAGLNVPLLSAWQDFLWHAGRHCKLIEAADSNPQGMAAWRINPDQKRWAELISQGLQNQSISFDGDNIINYYTVDHALEDGHLLEVPITIPQPTEPTMLDLANLQTPNFPLGRIVMTPGAQTLFEQGVDPNLLLQRHCLLDADLDAADLRANKDAVKNDLRIFSSYNTDHGKLWVITESDRSATTFLEPNEY